MTQREELALALRLAQRCRHIVEDALFDWEISDIDREFFDAILDELRRASGEPRDEREVVPLVRPADAGD